MRTRFALLAVAVALASPACDRGSPAAPLGDLSTSLEAARAAFNAHKGEARFLTLLSPT